MEENNKAIAEILINIGGTKQNIFRKTLEVFDKFKSRIEFFVDDIRNDVIKVDNSIEIECHAQGNFEIDLKVGSDTLVFVMHTNVFSFPPEHEIYKNKLVELDPTKGYCGMILIYDYLSDTFKYNRFNDIGYLVGRIFINKDGQFFVQGQRQFSFMYSEMTSMEINNDFIDHLIRLAIKQAVEFDSYAPPLDEIKEMTYLQKVQEIGSSAIKTGKRLGFEHNMDVIE